MQVGHCGVAAQHAGLVAGKLVGKVLQAHGVDDDQAQGVIEALGEGGFLVLTYACGLFETTQRARILLNAKRW